MIAPPSRDEDSECGGPRKQNCTISSKRTHYAYGRERVPRGSLLFLAEVLLIFLRPLAAMGAQTEPNEATSNGLRTIQKVKREPYWWPWTWTKSPSYKERVHDISPCRHELLVGKDMMSYPAGVSLSDLSRPFFYQCRWYMKLQRLGNIVGDVSLSQWAYRAKWGNLEWIKNNSKCQSRA